MAQQYREDIGPQGRVFISLFLATVVLLLSSCTRPGPEKTSGRLPPLDPAEVTEGRAVYVKYCASCHGPRAEGARNWTEPDVRGNLPPPPHDDTGHTWRHGDKELSQIILEGWRDPFNKTPELTMPPFKDRLSDEQIRAVITYFKSLWSEEHRRWQLEETRREQTGSPGEKRP
ncbi:MAG: c-type cytochrome [bacterium]